MRYIVFDTETTGLDPFNGDKIIEIGAVELIDRQRSGKVYHQLINPERPILQETIDITHITNEMVADKPTFKEVANDFLNFIKGSSATPTTLVAHNASFDIKFLNHELKFLDLAQELTQYEVIDTLDIARRKFPGQKATLDMLCEKFNISLEERKKEGHGALLDSQILVDVFLKLTEGSKNILTETDIVDFIGFNKRKEQLASRKFVLSKEEQENHELFLKQNNLTLF